MLPWTASDDSLHLRVVAAHRAMRERLFEPPVWGPVCDGGARTALLNFLTVTVSYDPAYIRALARKDGAPDSISVLARGIMGHEMAHYLCHPRELSTHVFLMYHAHQCFPDYGAQVYAYFSDVVADTLLMSMTDTPERERVLVAKWSASDSRVERALYRALHAMLGFSRPLNRDDADVVEAAQRVSAFHFRPQDSLAVQRSSLIAFGEAVLPLLSEDDRESVSGEGGASSIVGCRVTSDEIRALPPALQQQARDAVTKLARDLEQESFAELATSLFPDEPLPDAGYRAGVDAQEDTGLPSPQTMRYYRDLACAHGLFTRPRRLPARVVRWVAGAQRAYAPGDSCLSLRTHFSGGNILPGVTTRAAYVPIAVPVEERRMGTVVLKKDVSGSMRDPRKSRDAMTEASVLIGLSYLRSGASVLVSLFDAEDDPLVRATDEDTLLRVLCSYKGGGTLLDMDRLCQDLDVGRGETVRDVTLDALLLQYPEARAYVRKDAHVGLSDMPREVDLYVFTDGHIANIQDVVSFVRAHPLVRPTIIHTGTFPLAVPGYSGEDGSYAGITMVRAASPDDVVRASRMLALKRLTGGL